MITLLENIIVLLSWQQNLAPLGRVTELEYWSRTFKKKGARQLRQLKTGVGKL
jgi:hypothetical protein